MVDGRWRIRFREWMNLKNRSYIRFLLFFLLPHVLITVVKKVKSKYNMKEFIIQITSKICFSFWSSDCSDSSAVRDIKDNCQLCCNSHGYKKDKQDHIILFSPWFTLTNCSVATKSINIQIYLLFFGKSQKCNPEQPNPSRLNCQNFPTTLYWLGNWAGE